MENRFILPMTVAATLHALVLFGIKSPPADTIGEPHRAVPKIPPTVDVTIQDPPESREDLEPSPAPLKGHAEQFRPELDEPPPRPSLIEQERDAVRPRPAVIVTSIAAGRVGLPDGIEGGVTGPVVVNYTNLDNPPRTRSQVAPTYPADARNSGAVGEVLVEFVVDEGGRVLSPRIVRSTDGRFDAATLHAVERWRFEPGKKNGRAVRFRMVAPVVFSFEQP